VEALEERLDRALGGQWRGAPARHMTERGHWFDRLAARVASGQRLTRRAVGRDALASLAPSVPPAERLVPPVFGGDVVVTRRTALQMSAAAGLTAVPLANLV
jgi:hypothetical protein